MRRGAALALALAALVPAAPPASAKGLEIKIAGGEGQLRRIIAPRQSLESVLVIRFGAGYADEASVHGGTLVAVHALLSMHRRVKYGDLLETMHGATPRLTTSVGPHETVFTLRAHRDEMMGAANQLVTALLEPAFDAPAYAAAVERAAVDGAPRSPLDELLGRLSMFTFTSDARYRPEVDAERLESLTWPTAKRFVETMFCPANATAIAAGGFNPAAMEALLARHSGGERNTFRPPKLTLPMNHRFHTRDESHLFYFPLDLSDAEKVAAARVLVELLEDRVGTRLRRLPSSFQVEARAVAQAPFKGVTVWLPEHASAGTDLSAHVRQEVQAFREGRDTAEQLTAARDDAVRRFQQVDARPELLAEEILAGLDAAPDWVGADAQAALEKMDAKKLVELLGPQLLPEKSVHLFFSPEVSSTEATAFTDGEVPR
ncbi:MAG TPA: hypothetical protein VFA20_21645 [Myxococcaceae bacterium]|nr:hypothetical protein [Myxococcaceae bacterium]